MRNKYRVIYCSNEFDVILDGEGLDVLAVGDRDFKNQVYSTIGHNLFCAVVDLYPKIGLRKALIKAGAKVGK